ncbi:uncharacterized protein LOC117178827 [Belonocnema kinseyi]|uniref:uncharacterized protein LOC117178827 n=1 Tax=Belonocnema kinseyi TaxID=2817044 RepID=UPI00143D0E20|nr:uncharacterized protein LOC117178827 [Belonocnema kinseyi]
MNKVENVENDQTSNNVDKVIQQPQQQQQLTLHDAEVAVSVAASGTDLRLVKCNYNETCSYNQSYENEQKQLEKRNNELRPEITKVIETHMIGRSGSDGGRSDRKNDPYDIHIKIGVTKRFLVNNPELMVLQADKGNRTIILHLAEYYEKMINLLSDTNTYEKLESDPTLKIQNELYELISNWHKQKFISKRQVNNLACKNGTAPRIYGLPKIHKPDCPLRPVTPFCGSLLASLAKCLATVIQKITCKASTHVKNSWDVVEKLREISIPDDYTILSLDVKSMFTNISSRRAVVGTMKRWDRIADDLRANGMEIPRASFERAILSCINNSYCQFKGVFYKQIQGTPMGSPIYCAIAYVVMEDFENEIISSLSYTLVFSLRFDDDYLICLPKDQVIELLYRFNGHDDESLLKFILEESYSEREIAFLDVMVTVEDGGKVVTNWYRKEYWSGSYINYLSS